MEGGCHSALSDVVFLFLLTELAAVEGLFEDDFFVGEVDFLPFSLLFLERSPLIEVKSEDVSGAEGGM